MQNIVLRTRHHYTLTSVEQYCVFEFILLYSLYSSMDSYRT